MIKHTSTSSKFRTDAKLRFAQIYIDILSKTEHGGSDIDHAHGESFLFHLFGALDSFTIELSFYYETDLPVDNLTRGKLYNRLKQLKKHSIELTEIKTLEDDPKSWLNNAKWVRDHSAHIAGVPRQYNLGGENHRKVFLKDREGKNISEEHFLDLYSKWFTLMKELIEKCRESAINQH